MKEYKEYITEKTTTLYRGHSKNENPNKPNPHGITWVTPSKELAATYGDEVSKVKFNISGKNLKIPEMNKSGTIKDLLKYAPKPKTAEQQKLYDEVVHHFGGGKQIMDLPKFLHKIGSDRVIKFLKSMGISTILAVEDGVVTYGLIK